MLMIEPISFDEQDKNLFEISDLRLRADALKHSILPRLQALMHICIDMIRDAYSVEVLEDSILSLSPNFRMKREREIQVDYQWASVELGGRRKLGVWSGIARADGKPVQIVPYLFGFGLTGDGLGIRLMSRYGIKLTEESKRGVMQLLQRHGEWISELCRLAGIPWTIPVMPEVSRLQRQLSEGNLNIEYLGETLDYPITVEQVEELSFRFVSFYPVYDLCIRYAKGEPDRFAEMVARLNRWIMSLPSHEMPIDDAKTECRSGVADAALAQAAECRIKVMPALRWQVFQRDGWKCVACGKTSHDGVLLHLDHILPRSKGGKDGMDNLQTLCGECNIGKSNRDMTDLRMSARK